MLVEAVSKPRLGTHLFAYIRLMRPLAGALMSFVVLSSAILATQGRLAPERYLLIYLIGLIGGGAYASFNAYLDFDIDLKLPRKSSRPVAAGIIKPRSAVLYGLTLSAIAISLAWTFNPLASLIVLGGIFGVTFYTMIKRKTALSVIVSSLTNGFTVPTLGWVAAKGSLDPAGLIVALLITFWTLGHLIAISFAHGDEYEVIVRPTVLRSYGPSVALFSSIVAVSIVFTLSLLLPFFIELDWLYLTLALIFGLTLVVATIKLAGTRSPKDGLLVFKLSGMYVLAIFMGIILDVLIV